MPAVAARPTFKSSHLQAQSQNHQSAIFAAPVLGLDVSRPFTDQNPQTALILRNCIARRNGSELRGGFRRHTTNLGGIGTEASVKTIMGYQPPRGATSVQAAKLFAACSDGKIYDVSSQTNEAAVPAAAVTLAGQNEPGEVSFDNFATANTNYLLVVSAGFGYITYDHTGGWVNRNAALIGTVVAANVDFVMVWKNRIWFIEENSTRAHFLPVGQLTGTTSLFDFGPLLTHGGELRALASWTLDAGDGVDDKLVIVGSQGDVLVYGGTDPTAAATFGIIGRWFVGPPPAGRRFLGKYGGDLTILCEQGVEYISRMVSGRGLLDPGNATDDIIPHRYNEVIGRDIRSTRGQSGWCAVNVPGQEAAIVVTPHSAYVSGVQYCFSTIPAAWSEFKGMPMVSAEVFDGDLYFGTTNGRVGRAFICDSDDELTNGTVGTVVTGDVQTAFVAPNDDKMSLKRPLLIMPMFQASSAPSIKAQVNTEWSDTGVAGSPSYTPSSVSLWDSAVWNVAVWGGALNTFLAWLGATGLGVYLSLRLSFTGPRGTLFTSWKVVYEPGGIM
jgi:hypothetical protein